METSHLTEEQIIAILREQEHGMATAEVCRRHGISSATFSKWKARFGGMDVSDARRLKVLEEEESAKLKKLLAEAKGSACDSPDPEPALVAGLRVRSLRLWSTLSDSGCY